MFLLIIILLCIYIIYKYGINLNLIVEEISVNNLKKQYLVRNREDKQQAAEMLYKIDLILHKLVDKLDNNKEILKNDDMYQYVIGLKNKLNNTQIQENSGNNNYTSYSINKGEKLILCLRSKYTNELHNINDLVYVAIHELAHIACPEYNHTELFFKINRYLLLKAIEYKLYIYEDYNIHNVEYCGIQLNNNILS